MDEKYVAKHGIGKALRKKILTDPTIQFIDRDLLLRLFFEELNERQEIRTSASKRTKLQCRDFFWYLSFEGRLGQVSQCGFQNQAIKLKREKLLVKDSAGYWRGTKVINGRGCQHPNHRAIIWGLSRGKWSQYVVETLEDILDGGHKLAMVIDTNFADAYAPEYDSNEHIEDAVCGYSCMSGRPDEAQEFYGSIDGCKVARFLDKNGENIGRCIVYEYGGIRHFIRIYCAPQYMRDCLYTLRANMTESDLFGRRESIDDLELETSLSGESPNMYLDGNDYGLRVKDGKLFVCTDYDWDCKCTDDGMLGDNWGDSILTCAYCGEFINRHDSYIEDRESGNVYCCSDCADHDGLIQCEECGDWTSEWTETEDDRKFCCNDCARNAGYRCTEHGKWILEEDGLEINDCYFYEDEEDAEADGWHKCVECGEWTKMNYPCTDYQPRCPQCRMDGGWTLQYVKREVKDETSED